MEISTLSPDLIIFYDGGNDIMDPFCWDPRPGYPFNFMAYENNPIFKPEIEAYPFWSMVGLGSQIVRKFFFNYYKDEFFNQAKLRIQAGYLSLDWKKKIARTYTENHLKAYLLSRAVGAQFIGYFQPIYFYKNRLHPNEWHPPSDQKLAPEYTKEVRELIRQELASLREKYPDFMFEDLSELFVDNDQKIFVDYIHPVQSGMQMVADRIVKDLEEKKLIRQP